MTKPLVYLSSVEIMELKEKIEKKDRELTENKNEIKKLYSEIARLKKELNKNV